MEILNILMAFAALVVPFLIAWVIVNHEADKHSPQPERQARK